MPQRHTRQYGIFHVTICTRNRIPWCIRKGVPEIIIDNLVMTRNLQRAKLYAFAILPDHMHVIVEPKPGGLSRFMCSFKSNASRDARRIMNIHHQPVDAAPGPHPAEPPEAPLRGIGKMYPEAPQQIPDKDHHEYSFKAKPIIAWQKGYHDERIRDSRQFSKAMHYVQGNAMRHGLVQNVIDWPWSSLHYSDLLDLSETWID